MKTNDPVVTGISIATTGWAFQHREHRNGSWMPRLLWVLTSRSWIRIPINVFVIHHRDGPILFDTGINPAIANEPTYISQWIGRVLLRRIFRFEVTEQDALRYRLKALGIEPASIKQAVISHLHFDHSGGIADVPNAELLVGKTEWAQLSAPHPEHEWILREHIELPGANWRPIDFVPTDDPLLAPFGGAFDVTGDGSIMLIPTPGHSPGSLSMLVRTAGMPPVLLIGDLAYDPQLLLQGIVPGTGDAAQLKDSYAKVRALNKALPNMLILAAHDPAASELVKIAVSPDQGLSNRN